MWTHTKDWTNMDLCFFLLYFIAAIFLATIEKDIYIFLIFIKSNSSWALLNKLHKQQSIFTKLHTSVVGIVQLVSAAIQTQDRNKRFCKLEVLTLDDEGDD